MIMRLVGNAAAAYVDLLTMAQVARAQTGARRHRGAACVGGSAIGLDVRPVGRMPFAPRRQRNSIR